MRDKLGRSIDYLRISLTKQCNLRCLYCLPSSSSACSENKYTLTQDDYLRLAAIFASLGIKKIRLTGGEPLLYPQLPNMVSSLRQIKGIEKIALTTNGILLGRQLEKLIQSGLSQINISLDAMQPDLFKRMTRGGRLQSVLDGIALAKKLRLPVKINSVIIKHCNEDQIIPLTEFAQKNDIMLRFIELMPFGQASLYSGISEAQIKKILTKHFSPLHELPIKNETGPAHYYLFSSASLQAPIGFISAVSHSFCAFCSRIRLTSDGILRPCLLHDSGLDLKQMIADNCSDEQLRLAMEQFIFNKPKQHELSKGVFLLKDCKSMAQIGG